MKKFILLKKRILLLMASLLFIQMLSMIGSPITYAADPVPVAELKLDVKSALLMEVSTGEILYENNADVAYPPASMAKMMTEYILLENIDSGKIKWDDKVAASQYAADVIGSGGQIAKGEVLTIKQLFSAMSIYSANDASVILAEHIGGTEEKFATMMNDKSKELGLSKDAHFINATGLSRTDMGKYAPTTLTGETVFSARDAALLARHVILDHKEVLTFTKTPTQKLRDKDPTPMINWNWMLEGNKDNVNFKKYAYVGLDGLKTGHTDEAGYCFTATAERNGIRFISVVMGTATEPKRFEETRKVLDYGFLNYELKQIVTENTSMDTLKTVPLKKGVQTEIPVVTQSALTLVVKKGTTDAQIVKETVLADSSKLIAPIKKGAVLGTLKVTYNNKTKEVNLVATDDVKKGGWFRLLFRAIKNFFVDLLSGIKNIF